MENIEGILTGLEEKSLQANVNEDVDYFRESTTNNFLVVAPFGVFDKPAIIGQLEKKQGVPFKSARMESPRVLKLTEGCALITYRVAIVAVVQEKEITLRRYVTTAYVKQGGAWRSAFSQHTDIRS